MSKINRRGLRITVAAVAAGAAAVAGSALAASAQAAPLASANSHYRYTTLNNQHDVTFNQLLGINNHNQIAGYFGSGAAGHPNKGYLLLPPYTQHSYVNENFPGSAQTQVVGLNDNGVSVGFWAPTNLGSGDANHGFYVKNGRAHNADFPTHSPASPVFDQLLGVNDSNVAVGVYNDAAGTAHGYEYNISNGHFAAVTDPHAPSTSLTAAGINNHGDVAGFYTNPANGNTDGFLKEGGRFTDLAFPGASSTMATGVNDKDEVVGFYMVGSGSSALSHGFTWTPSHGFTTVDDPNGLGATALNGVNNAGDLVGFYTDGAGNTDGFLATPRS